MSLFSYALLAAGAFLALTTAPAAATPIAWQLENAVLPGGRIATGKFVFDATPEAYSNIDIVTAPSPTNHYGSVNPSFSSNFLRMVLVTGSLPGYTGTPVLFITWSSPFLSNAGGTVPFSIGRSYEAVCENADCSAISNPTDSFVSGEAVSVAEPASLTLLAVGLFGLAIGRRRLGMRAVAGDA